MSIPFSLPLLDESVINEVVDALTNTGWITSGPKVQQLEQEIGNYVGCPHSIAVSSWTTGAMVVLRWLGIGPGDEVIVPSYTYCATALAVMNVGATPIMVDVESPFHMDIDKLSAAISDRTKAIIPVDLGGWPCDYDRILDVLNSDEVRCKFRPASRVQEQLGRPLILSDAAHSLGAERAGKRVGMLTDVTVFSFHSVKNLTTGEGGMICLNLPDGFDPQEEQRTIKYLSLNGQTKTALEKSTVGGWRYDIVDQGFKANMPDLCAAVGLAQIRQYESRMMPERKRIFDIYNEAFTGHEWAILPPMQDNNCKSSLHLFQLRIDGIDEEGRNRMMRLIAEDGIGVNVHYVPMPMLTLFRNKGYQMSDYPNAFALYANEITLPVYNGLGEENARTVAQSVISARSRI